MAAMRQLLLRAIAHKEALTVVPSLLVPIFPGAATLPPLLSVAEVSKQT
jgi:hypothetical protein